MPKFKSANYPDHNFIELAPIELALPNGPPRRLITFTTASRAENKRRYEYQSVSLDIETARKLYRALSKVIG